VKDKITVCHTQDPVTSLLSLPAGARLLVCLDCCITGPFPGKPAPWAATTASARASRCPAGRRLTAVCARRPRSANRPA
jgi:hypothetical protein